jgi:hypothetical protein
MPNVTKETPYLKLHHSHKILSVASSAFILIWSINILVIFRLPSSEQRFYICYVCCLYILNFIINPYIIWSSLNEDNIPVSQMVAYGHYSKKNLIPIKFWINQSTALTVQLHVYVLTTYIASTIILFVTLLHILIWRVATATKLVTPWRRPGYMPKICVGASYNEYKNILQLART